MPLVMIIRKEYGRTFQLDNISKVNMDEQQDFLSGSAQSTSSTKSTAKKNVKGPTKMKYVATKRLKGEKIHVDIDEITGQPIGDSAAQFMSTLGVHARTKISILIPSWDDVEEVVKNIFGLIL